jgi:transcriptional regulator with XRE-family HTH domain
MKVQAIIKLEGLGDRIRTARKLDRRSLLEICKEINITSAAWYNIENEKVKVLPLETLKKIESVLKVDIGISELSIK